MAEYIDREKEKSLLHIEYAYAAEQLLDEIPAADVAPVVRCRDCKHYDRGECYHPRHEHHLQSICQEDDDFCSYGERKDGEEHVE